VGRRGAGIEEGGNGCRGGWGKRQGKGELRRAGGGADREKVIYGKGIGREGRGGSGGRGAETRSGV